MTSPAPAAAAHPCIGCAALPPLPPGAPKPDGSYTRAGYRPPKPRPTTGGPRSQRCTEHRLAHRRATKATSAAGRKAARYGLTRDLQVALWVAQGRRCPCGARATDGDEPPSGVHTDHNHDLAAAHDHPDDRGCLDCVTGYLCPSCNRDIVGRLTGQRGRGNVAAALEQLAAFLRDPPLARLLATPDHEQDHAA